MPLRTLLIVAFGPALAVCQVQPTVGSAAYQSEVQSGATNNDDRWAAGSLDNRQTQCAVMPRIPQTFVAKRRFFSFLNTIVFEDRHGNEFGFVESWLGDKKNLFGFPGASFYLKAAPTDGDDGLFNLEGPTAGQDGTFESSPVTNQGEGAQGESTWGSFFRSVRGDQNHRLAGFMVGNQEPPNGRPWLDQMEIRDCKGDVTAKAEDGALIIRGAIDAQYHQRRTNTENEVVVEDLGQPPQELVRITMKEPCKPFPPFCAQMGVWNWFLHGYSWEGRIMRPGSSNTMAGLGAMLDIQVSSGAAEDVRFLTLYSAYQFSNTRWSPFMNWIWWILFFSPIVCCCWRSWWGCWRLGDSPKVEQQEETQKLMQTQEVEMGTKVPEEKQSTGGFMACCSRRGRVVAAN